MRAEHDAHGVPIASQKLGKHAGIPRDRTIEFQQGQFVISATAGAAVRAHDYAGYFAHRLPEPLLPGLTYQRDAWRHKQHGLGSQSLGDSQRRERLSSSTGHDEPAPVVVSQPIHATLNGNVLFGEGSVRALDALVIQPVVAVLVVEGDVAAVAAP